MTDLPPAIQKFLEGLQTGDWTGIEQYLTPDAIYDATVPGWRYQYRGAERIARELREDWTGRNTWRIVELHVTPTRDGVVVDFEARGRRPQGAALREGEVCARLANIFRLEGGRIAEHRFYCAGEWDEATVRRIENEAPLLSERA
jgi:ketosteroid isomerase-like protein